MSRNGIKLHLTDLSSTHEKKKILQAKTRRGPILCGLLPCYLAQEVGARRHNRRHKYCIRIRAGATASRIWAPKSTVNDAMNLGITTVTINTDALDKWVGVTPRTSVSFCFSLSCLRTNVLIILFCPVNFGRIVYTRPRTINESCQLNN